ncbi:MAG: hypothetical protein CR988_03220 [Treponema sp.]|nr:MAG: hypothetical protein CR988_03220 [Treponema sp.]
MKSWTKNDTIFTTIVVSLIIALLVFYVIDINKVSDYKGERIGVIQFRIPVATRNHNTVLVWDRLKNNSPLYGSDTIRTEEHSEAKILFDNNDMVLNLSGNTMIKLPPSMDDGIQDIGNMVSADMTISSQSEEREINVSGQKITLEKNTTVIIRKKKDNQDVTECEVIEGSIRVNEDNKEVVVTKNETVTINSKKGAIELKQTVFSLIAPKHNSHSIVNSEKTAVSFSWSTTTSEPGFIELSTDSGFKKIIANIEPENTENKSGATYCNAVAEIDSGAFFWRVKTSDGTVSQPRKFRIESIKEVKLLNPVSKELFEFFAKAPKINFVWSEDSVAIGYKLQISKSPSFDDVLFETETGMNSITISEFNTEGKYFWRVRPMYPDHLSINNEDSTLPVSEFLLTKKEGIEPPVIISPAPDFVYNVENFLSTGMNLSWKNIQEAESYEISIYESEDSTTPIEVINSKLSFVKLDETNSSAIKNLDSYYWTVSWIDSEGKKSQESAKRYVKNVSGNQFIKALAPIEGYRIEQSISDSMVFTWKMSTEGRTVFYLAKDLDFKNIVLQQDVKTTNFLCPYLDLGKYYWVVKSYDDKGSLLTESQVRGLEVVPPHAPPELLDFENDSFISILNGTSQMVDIKWTEVADADFYDLKIYDENGNMKVQNPFYTSNEFSLKVDDTQTTSYTVVVQAFTNDSIRSSRIIGLRNSTNFTVRVLNPIELVSPLNNARMREVDVEITNPVLSWKSDEVLDEPVVEAICNDVKVPAGKLVRISDNSVRLVDPKPGSYRWTVKAVQYGCDVSATEYNSFIIIPKLEPLARPVFVEDKMMKGFDSNYLKKTPELLCRWKPVPSAQYYYVKLYRKGYKKPLIEMQTKDTSVILTDLSMLSAGKFYWDVAGEAEVMVDDEALIREGRHAQFNFTIKIPKVGEIEPDTGGTYYGY